MITTQIVEASLDIDFDVLYTEMCTADSLLQRMGRCNRAGKKSTDEPNIFIFKCGTPKKGNMMVFMIRIFMNVPSNF